MGPSIELPSADFVESLRQRREIIGALMVGSAVRGTADGDSDRDIEVVVDDGHYDRMLPADRIVRQGRDELFTIPARDFFGKKGSSRDVDHWPYQACVLLFDRDGAIAGELPRICEMPDATRRARIDLHAFELLFLLRRIARLHARQAILDSHLTAAQASIAAMKLVFVHACLWPPLMHASQHELALLGGGAVGLADVLVEMLRRPDGAAADRVLREVRRIVGDCLPEHEGDAHLLTCDVTAEPFRAWRQQHGLF